MVKEKFLGYRVAVGCGLIIFFHLACCYIWAVMLPYFLNKFNCSLTLLSTSSSLGTVVGFCASLVSGTAIQKWKPRRMLMFSTLVCAAFMVISAFATSPWMLYVANGISGFILAFGAQVTCAAIINRWFIEKRNTIIGVVFGASAFGGALYMFLAGNMIHVMGQTGTYLILGAIAIGVNLLCEIFLIKNTPEEIGQKPLGWKNEASQDSKKEVYTSEKTSVISPEEARKSGTFFIMVFATFFAAMLLTTFSSFATTFWTTNGISQASAATYASIVTLLGGVVSIVVGSVADKWGIKTFISVIFGTFAIGLCMAIIWGSVMPVTMILVLNIIFISAGTPIQNISSSVVLPIFGSKAADSINGNLMAFFYAGSAICIIIFSTLFDILGSFIPIFIIVLVLTFIVLILMMTAIKFAPTRRERK